VKRGHLPQCCKGELELHPECTTESCKRCEVCREHAVFVNATRRKMANGERQKLIRMFAEESQVRAFYGIWRTWLNRWSKVEAMDRLVSAVCEEEARWQDHRRLEAESKKRKKAK
jgi:hypothetical protein